MVDPNLSLPHDQSQPSRRAVLGALAAAPVAAVPALGAEPVDPHVAWERQLAVLLARMDGMPHADSPEYQEAWDEWIGVQDQICLTPAHTPAGIATQVRRAVIATEEGSTLSDAEEAGLRNAVRSLAALAGVPDGLPAEREEEEQAWEPSAVTAPRSDLYAGWLAFAEAYRPDSYDADVLAKLIGRCCGDQLAIVGVVLNLVGKVEAGAAVVAALPAELRATAGECMGQRLAGRA